MVYELTVQSVKLKSTLFTPPSRLINTCEVTCAIGMLYKKAGQPMPEVTTQKTAIYPKLSVATPGSTTMK